MKRFVLLLLLLATTTVVAIGLGQTTTSKGKQILVILNQQKLFAIENGQPFYEFHCSTGRRGMTTPTGLTKVRAKLRYNRALPEYGGGAIPYTLRIHSFDPKTKKIRRINIHAYDSVPSYPASHGCIRLSKKDAAKLFGWAEVGIPVAIITGPLTSKKKS
ncbi:MAG: L,D-transpeptidase [Patescibacteria group bacterium]